MVNGEADSETPERNQPELAVDTNVLLNLAKPVVDQSNGLTGVDPLKRVLTGYDIKAPDVVFGELSEQMTEKNGILEAAAETVLRASGSIDKIKKYPGPGTGTAGLDAGERAAISVANDRNLLLASDEFASRNLALVITSLNDANSWTSTPELLCRLGDTNRMHQREVERLLAYYEQHCGWTGEYVDENKRKYL